MKRHAPATTRNSEPIADILAHELPKQGTVLEIASGSGEHALFFARRFPNLHWQPSDLDVEALASIDAYLEDSDLPNIAPSIQLNAAQTPWTVENVNAILCVNMIHISPWSAATGLIAEAARLLPKGAPLILYGPYFEREVEPSPSNLDFDLSLRSRDPHWGIRHIEDVDAFAEEEGLSRSARYEMPANNLTLVYRRQLHGSSA